ncbi:hypothetical protein LIER_09131 [Lithospermum erythrorhizon]|uniref:Uncharacterized protein n=1 Tax=Lithospermum erythrorhizon TaxID=34254 RepID=A0AAV3PFM0_LITER
MTDPPANPSVEDTTGKSAEPSFLSEVFAGDFGKNLNGGDIPNVTYTDAETARQEKRSIVVQGDDDTMDVDIKEVIP